MNTKKAITGLVAFLMIVSVMIFVVPQSSATASGSVNYTPSVFSINTATLTVANGGTFGSGSTIYFYISTTKSSTGIIGSYVGTYTLSGGVTTLSNAHFRITIPSTISPGSYYILASDSPSPTSTSAQFTAPFPIAVTSLLPAITVSGNQPTTAGSVQGTGWDPFASVSVYLTGSDGTPINYIFLGTYTAGTTGSFVGKFTVPSIAQGSYTIVAMETSGTNSGITADSTISITPILIVTPYDINGVAGTTITVTGYGFLPYAKINANSINAGGVTISNPATTTNGNGYFSVSGSLSSSITTTGPQYVSVTYNSSSYMQSNAFFVSTPNPSNLGFTFTLIMYYPNSAFTATVYNFPSSSVVSIMFGGISLGNINTDSNGFGILTGILPAMVAGQYYPVAESNGLYKTLSPVTISSYYEVLDSYGNLMTNTYNEYMPNGSTYKVVAYGLNPLNTYTLSDGGASTIHYAGSQVMSIVSGTMINRFTFTPAANGTLIFVFKSYYSAPAGAFETVALSGVIGYESLTFGYKVVGTPSISLNMLSIFNPGKSVTMTINNLIPQGANVYPGLSYIYNVYLGSNELTFTTASGSTTLVMSSSSSSYSTGTLTFTVPSLSSGIYNMSIVYNGAGVSSAIYSQPMIVSVVGTSYTSGTLYTLEMNGYVYIAGVSYYGTSVQLYYMTYTQQSGPYTMGLTYGAFYYNFPMPAEPAGSYAVFTVEKSGTASYYIYAYYTVTQSIRLTQNSGSISAPISFTLSGFSPNSYYTLYMSGIFLGTYVTDSTGSLQSSFTVPIVPAGTYSVSVVPSGTNNVVASARFTVVPSSTLVLSTGNYAFPGQLVNFTWTPGTLPNQPSPPTSGSPYYGPVYVTVYLNGSAYESFTSYYASGSGAIMGAFTMPNAMPGSYYEVTLSWSQNTYTTTVSGSGSTAVTTTVVTSTTYMMPPGNGVYLGIVSGNGALLTGITPSEIATLEVAINNTITSTMQVPLSELNAAVISIQGTSALINTSFGQMKASLKSINASIAKIINGQAYINTTLGNIETGISNIDASITGVNGSLIKIQTSVGTVITSLNNLKPIIESINATTISISTLAGNINYNLTSFHNLEIKAINNGFVEISGNINGMNVTLESTLSSMNVVIKSTASNVNSLVGSSATIETSLGNITGKIVSVQNGIATIQTSLGKMNVTVNNIQTTGSSNSNTLGTAFYMDIVIIVLLLIILAFAVMAYISSRKSKSPPKEWK